MAARILINSSWNFAAFAFSVLANFVAIPFVVRHIGLTAFGEVGLLLAVFAPMSLIGTVIGQAIVRVTAMRHGKPGQAEANDALWTAIVLTVVSCTLVTVLFCMGIRLVGAWMAARGLVLDDPLLPLVVALGWMAQQVALVLQSAFAGAQRYRDIATATVASTVLSVGSTLIGTWALPDSFGYARGMAIGFGLTLSIWLAWVAVAFPGALRPRRPSRERGREIVAFGRWQAVAFLAGNVAAQADRYLLGLWTPLKAVGQYSVAVRLQEVVSMAVLKISEVLFPHFGATSADAQEQRRAFFVGCSWVVGVVSVVTMVPLIPLARSLLTLWIGPEAADAGAPVLHLLLTAAVLGAAATVYAYHALGTGHSDELAAVNIAQAACTILVAVPMVHQFGIAGAGVGMVVGNALRLAACWYLAARHFGRHLDFATLSRIAGAPVGTGLATGWLLAAWLQPTVVHWASFIAAYIGLAAATLLVVLAATGALPVGRRLLATLYRRNAAST